MPQRGESYTPTSILVHQNGHLQAIGSIRNKNYVFSTISEDNGLTWSPPWLLDSLVNRDKIDAVTLKDGRHVLIYNTITTELVGKTHYDQKTHYQHVFPLVVAVSKEGLKWEAALNLDKSSSPHAVIQTRDGLLHVVYSQKRVDNTLIIKHVVVDPAKLTSTPMIGGKWPSKG